MRDKDTVINRTCETCRFWYDASWLIGVKHREITKRVKQLIPDGYGDCQGHIPGGELGYAGLVIFGPSNKVHALFHRTFGCNAWTPKQ